jgi:transposase InsO family protein
VELAVAIRQSFQASGFAYGSPRVWLDLHEVGWRVSVKTVAAVMAEHGWAGRKPPRRRSLTRQGRRPVAPDLVGRRFIASRPDQLWCGNVTYVDTGEGWLYLATVLDLCSRRQLGYAMADAHDAALTEAALRMAVTTRAGDAAAPAAGRGFDIADGAGARGWRLLVHPTRRHPCSAPKPAPARGRRRRLSTRSRNGFHHLDRDGGPGYRTGDRSRPSP